MDRKQANETIQSVARSALMEFMNNRMEDIQSLIDEDNDGWMGDYVEALQHVSDMADTTGDSRIKSMCISVEVAIGIWVPEGDIPPVYSGGLRNEMRRRNGIRYYARSYDEVYPDDNPSFDIERKIT
jgi:hypothetical protein